RSSRPAGRGWMRRPSSVPSGWRLRSTRWRAATTTSPSTPASRPMRSTTASRALHHAPFWSRPGLRRRSPMRYGITWQAPASAISRCSPAGRLRSRPRTSAFPPDTARISIVGRLKQGVLRAGMEALYFSGAHRLLRPLLGGVGAIVTLHHVRPPRTDAFQPNRLLEVSPAFLEDVIKSLRRAQAEIVTLDEMHRRLKEQDFRRRFVCFTFDDGYRDNLRYALPILKKYEVPFAIYIPTSFPDRAGELWWLTLEAVIARLSRLALVMDGEERRYDCHSTEAKYELYEHIYWWLR